MEKKVPCKFCGETAILIKATVKEGAFIYKCIECKWRFLTKDLVDHNKNISKEVDVFFEHPYMERFAIGAIVCSFGFGDIEPRLELYGVKATENGLIFKTVDRE